MNVFDDEVAAWRQLGDRLGIVVEAPFTLVTARGEHAFVARVPGFGAPQGTLVRATVVDDGAIQAATTAAYGSSHVCVANARNDIEGIIEMLAEWSWCSDEQPPAWLVDIAHSDAATEHEAEREHPPRPQERDPLSAARVSAMPKAGRRLRGPAAQPPEISSKRARRVSGTLALEGS